MSDGDSLTAMPPRRLSEKLIAAARQACEEGELWTADMLLHEAERLLQSEETKLRHALQLTRELLVQARARLWKLRHPML